MSYAQGAPWSVRLSAKLLREVAAGPASPWWPYLQVRSDSYKADSLTWSVSNISQLINAGPPRYPPCIYVHA